MRGSDPLAIFGRLGGQLLAISLLAVTLAGCDDNQVDTPANNPVVGGPATIQGTVDDGTAASPVPNALCHMEDLSGDLINPPGAFAADENGDFEISVEADVQGFVVCTPPDLPGIQLRRYVSTLGMAGQTISQADVTPQSTAAAGEIDLTLTGADLDAAADAALAQANDVTTDLGLIANAAAETLAGILHGIADGTLDADDLAGLTNDAVLEDLADGSIDLPILAPIAAGIEEAIAELEEQAGQTLEDAIANTQSFWLQLLHFSDIDGAGGADDVRNFSALVSGFRAQLPNNTLLLSSGDNLIPGPEFFAAGDDAMDEVLDGAGSGRAHIAWLNAMGVQASAVGNHDLDAGVGDFAELISPDGDWPGAQFPYLSANIDFSTDEDIAGLIVDDAQPALPNSVAGSATLMVDNRMIGIVGATTPNLPAITSTGGLTLAPADFDPNDAADLDALAAEIQAEVDALTAMGVNKIILLAHMQQIAVESALAPRLSDVDIIIAGGSNTLLADANDRLRDGDVATDTYPLSFNSASGEPVLVVNTDGDYTYLGRLMVEFDANGVIQEDSLDSLNNGVYATDMLDFPFSPIAQVDDITDALDDVLEEKDGNVLGITDVYLDGRRSEVRSEETNLGNLTADANLWMAQQADPNVLISLKNGGGIRSDIGIALQPYGSNDPADTQYLPPYANDAIGKPAGGISQLDLETALRFNNGLTLLTVTAAELADIMEHAVSASGDGATPGQFPQVSGMRFSFDTSQAAREVNDTNMADVNIAGDRLRNLAVVDDSGAVIDSVVEDGMVVGDPDRTFRLVILDFIAKCVDSAEPTSCGDSYPLNGLNNPERVDLSDAGLDAGQFTFAAPGSEQDALAEYLGGFFGEFGFDQAETDPADDLRIQDLAVRGDSVADLPPGAFQLNKIGGLGGLPGAEISAFNADDGILYVTSGDAVQQVDVSDPTAPAGLMAPFTPANDLGGFTVDGVTSVAYRDGILALAVAADPVQDPGKVAFYAADGTFLGSVDAGALPDMVTWSRDGTRVFVANEGEPDATDPEGTVSIIDVPAGATPAARIAGATVATVDFQAENANRDALVAAGVRIFDAAATVAQDLEPEYIAEAPDGTLFVSLQEANSLAKIDPDTATLIDLLPLGTKDHSAAGNGLDSSDKDNEINIQLRPLMGLYMPDGIAATEIGGNTYVLTANEGDARDFYGDDDRAKDLVLDPTAFPNAAELQDDDVLGRIDISTVDGDTDTDGDFDQLFSYGARSFSIFDAAGNRVFDSGDDIARVTAQLTPGFFNANDGDAGEFDKRSDNKGAEPEAVVTGEVDGRTYAFVGLERAAGGVLAFDISNPRMGRFVAYAPGAPDGDIATEGLLFIPADQSPNGNELIITSNEESSTVAIYSIDR